MAGRAGGGVGDDDDDDYMGDVSHFLPPDLCSSSAARKKFGGKEPPLPPPSKPKRPKGLSWQEQQRLDRERKQREEDGRTLVGLETAIPDSNVGFRLLRQMGYKPGSALGKDGNGLAEPVGLEIRRSRAGIGVASPREEAARRGRAVVERKRRREEELAAEFGSRQRMQWRSRRVVGDYRKADMALAQLENREIVEPPKDEGEEGAKPEEEEEEIITEEYESAEALAINCPGLEEDDH